MDDRFNVGCEKKGEVQNGFRIWGLNNWKGRAVLYGAGEEYRRSG